MSEFGKRMIKALHNIEELKKTKGTLEFESEVRSLLDMIEEAKKDFPMTDIDDSQGYGAAQDFLEDIWEWYMKWF